MPRDDRPRRARRADDDDDRDDVPAGRRPKPKDNNLKWVLIVVAGVLVLPVLVVIVLGIAAFLLMGGG